MGKIRTQTSADRTGLFRPIRPRCFRALAFLREVLGTDDGEFAVEDAGDGSAVHHDDDALIGHEAERASRVVARREHLLLSFDGDDLRLRVLLELLARDRTLGLLRST